MPTNINGKKYYSIDEMKEKAGRHIEKEAKRLEAEFKKSAAKKIYVSNLTIDEKLKYHGKYIFYEVMPDKNNKIIHISDNFHDFDEKLMEWMEKNWYWAFSDNPLDKERYRMENV